MIGQDMNAPTAQRSQHDDHDSRGRDAEDHASKRSAGLLIGVGSLLLIVLMAAHPFVHVHDTPGVVAELARISVRNGIVHGGLLLVMSTVFVGFLGLCSQLGWTLQRVRAGAVFYALGLVCMIAAALVNGFVVPGLAAGYAGRPDAELQALKPILHFAVQANQTAAKAGSIALSIAIVAWSSVLWRRGVAARWIGILGLIVGVLALTGLLSGHLHLDVHGMGAFVFATSLWNACVAVWLMRARAPSRT